MTNEEFKRLQRYAYANKYQYRPALTRKGRASIKARANGKGMILRKSKVVHTVGLEKVFTQFK